VSVDLNLINAILEENSLNSRGRRGTVLDKQQLEMLLEQRVKGGEALSDFFLIIPSDDEGKTEITLELTFPFWDRKGSEYYQDPTLIDGKREVTMKVFFCKDAPHAALCSHRLMEYPNVSKPAPNSNLVGHYSKKY